MTSMEREDKEKVKKREKKLEDEETLQQATWVKYTIPIKHQVRQRLNFYPLLPQRSQLGVNAAGHMNKSSLTLITHI